jgi:cytochrome P450
MSMVFDPQDPAFIADPFPTFARLRVEDPVHHSAALGGWILTRYADVLGALRDQRLSSDRITPFFDALSEDERIKVKPLGDSLRKWAVFSDPPQHTRLRTLFNKAFTPRAVERLRSAMKNLVEELLAPALIRRRIDLIADLAYPLPALVICQMIGLPLDNLEKIKVWSAAIENFLGLAKKPKPIYDAARSNMEEMGEFFRQVVNDRRRHPCEDILSGLIAASEEGERLSEDELIGMCTMLVFAAHTTTTHLIGNGMLALLRQPEALAMLRADLSEPTMERAVEEFLRYDGPVQVARRVVLEPIQIDGRRIDAEEIIFPMLNAANRDPQQFPDPDRLDLARAQNRHIAFGFGPHFCAGAPLARMEAQIAFTAILQKLDDIQIAGPVEWIESFGFRGLKALPLEFRVSQ